MKKYLLALINLFIQHLAVRCLAKRNYTEKKICRCLLLNDIYTNSFLKCNKKFLHPTIDRYAVCISRFCSLRAASDYNVKKDLTQPVSNNFIN